MRALIGNAAGLNSDIAAFSSRNQRVGYKNLHCIVHIRTELISALNNPIAALVSPGYLSLWSIPLVASVVSIIVSMLTNTSDAEHDVR